MDKREKVVITGAAGLVGQNLVLLLGEMGYSALVALDKHVGNLDVLRSVSPTARLVAADLSTPGPWQDEFRDASCAIILHAQITGKSSLLFMQNNITATRNVLDAVVAHSVPYTIHVSSSVVNSGASDHYTKTKRAQEELVRGTRIPHCILRPTVMFGWFDPKHFGWLSRFMEKAPVFPIPGDGKYMRQPLYNRDFCRVIEWCMAHRPAGATFDIVGAERIDYVDIIKTIRWVRGLRTPLVHLPVWLFGLLLKAYALFSPRPPFTADQLRALAAGDDFNGVDLEQTFGIRPTRFAEAIQETFCDPRYSHVVVAR